MSYFCKGDLMVRDMWPRVLADEMDCTLDKADLASWAIVPDSYDGVCEWAVVMPNDEGRANKSTLLYSTDNSPSAEGNPVRITVVVHGLVESVNMRPLGNYKGHVSAAGRAVQYITLSGGAWPEAFGAQLSSLKCIRDYVGSVFGVHVEDAAHNPGTIHFHRPVFTSTKAGLLSVLRLGDDPEGLAEDIKRQWVVAHRVRTGIAGVGRAAATSIRKGDFVAVAATLDVVKTLVKQQNNKQWRTELRLSMREVSRLMAVDDVTMLNPTQPSVPAVAPRRVRVVEMMVLGLDDDDEDGVDDSMYDSNAT